MDDITTLILITLGLGALLIFGIIMMFVRMYRKVEQGKALIVNSMKSEPTVHFSGALVIPIIHKAEVMDISVKTIEVDRRGKEGLICQDNIRADIKVTFFVRVNNISKDVLKVAQAVGCERASNRDTIIELFGAKFSEALKTVGKRLDFEDLYKERDNFKDQIIQVIGKDLNGFVLDDAAIDYLEQTPVESLDPDNILDAQGIRKITELTAIQKVRTNEFERDAEKQIKKKDVEAREAILALERQEADAHAKQQREIKTVQAREHAEILRVQAEEKQKAEGARIKTEEELAIQEENKQRQVQVAEKNRERVIAIENERVLKDQSLEAISRERETELQRIEKEKALEKERKEIQDIIRERIAVEKTVAEEEERIKDLRMIAEAKRLKEQTVITAEAEAQEMLVKELKAAEVAEQAAKFKAKERLTLAEADLEAADKHAKAKIRMAEGIQAETAAQGLAEVQVKEADALAREKQGLAQVRVKEADAAAVEKQGLAEAKVMREKMVAEASGAEEKGMADIRVRDADAAVIQRRGEAEARAIQEKLDAEAAGLASKAEAMKALDGVGREHEEFRIKLEAEKEVQLEGIRINRDIAMAQAKILGAAFQNARIDIVGGESLFVDKLVNAISTGKSIDGVVGRSDTASRLLNDYLSGDANLIKDLSGVARSMGAEGVKDLTVASFLKHLMTRSDTANVSGLAKLAEEAQKLGVADLPLSGE